MNIRINFAAAQLLTTLLIEEDASLMRALKSENMEVETRLRLQDRRNMVDSITAIIQSAK